MEETDCPPHPAPPSRLPALLSPKTAEETNERMNNLKVDESVPVRNWTSGDGRGFEAPGSVDWREDGLVSPVQNQVGSVKLMGGGVKP